MQNAITNHNGAIMSILLAIIKTAVLGNLKQKVITLAVNAAVKRAFRWYDERSKKKAAAKAKRRRMAKEGPRRSRR